MKRIISKSRSYLETDLIAIVLLITSYLYFYRIESVSLWYDELITLHTFSGSNPLEFISRYWQDNFHPPLYFVLNKIYIHFDEVILQTMYPTMIFSLAPNLYLLDSIWSQILDFNGANHISDLIGFLIHTNYFYNDSTELSLRLLSATSMLFTNLYLMIFFRQRSLLIVGLSSAFLMGLHYRIIYYAQEGRPYALFTFLSAVAALKFYSNLFENNNSNPLLNKSLKKSSIALFFTHYFSVFIFMAQIFMLLIKKITKKEKIKKLAMLLLAVIVLCVAFLTFQKTEKLSYLKSFSFSFLYEMYYFNFADLIDVKMWILLLVLSGWAFYKQKNSNWLKLATYFFFYPLTIILFAALISIYKPLLDNRYFLFLTPIWIVLFALLNFGALNTLFALVKNKSLKNILLVTCMLLMTFRVCFKQYGYLTQTEAYYEMEKHYPLKQAFQQIKKYSLGTSFYIAEEHYASIFLPYEQELDFKRMGTLSPEMSYNHKADLIIQNLLTTETKLFFILKGLHSVNSQDEAYQINGYNHQRIFKKSNLEAHMYSKQSP